MNTKLTADGSKAIYSAGPEVVDLDQIRVGDHVKATVAAELAKTFKVRKDVDLIKQSVGREVAFA